MNAAERVFADAVSDPVTVWSPGRVNLIGDHIDYSGGFVLPMAIDRGTSAVIFPRPDRVLRGYSANFADAGVVVATLDELEHDPRSGWFNYVLAVVWALREAGCDIPTGFDIHLTGTIPNEAGLSSSASVELAVGVGVDALHRLGLTATELALLGQRAENEFIGVACGIMDQLAIAAGVAGHALLMDCAQVTCEPVPMPAQRATVVVTNTNQRRTLAGSEYNDRRAAVERGRTILATARGGPLPRLVDATMAELAGAETELRAAGAYPFVRHTITEQARVIAGAAALRRGDVAEFGALMRQSHESLAADFQVTSPELDALAQAAWSTPGVIGARMTGAGFGGCTVNLIEPGAVDEAVPAILSQYRTTTGLAATAFVVAAGAGAHVVEPGPGIP
jgi:galactokinase